MGITEDILRQTEKTKERAEESLKVHQDMIHAMDKIINGPSKDEINESLRRCATMAEEFIQATLEAHKNENPERVFFNLTMLEKKVKNMKEWAWRYYYDES